VRKSVGQFDEVVTQPPHKNCIIFFALIEMLKWRILSFGVRRLSYSSSRSISWCGMERLAIAVSAFPQLQMRRIMVNNQIFSPISLRQCLINSPRRTYTNESTSSSLDISPNDFHHLYLSFCRENQLEPNAGCNDIPHELNPLIELIKLNGLQIVDVREDHELWSTRLDQNEFVHLPMTRFEIWSKKVNEYLSPTTPTIVVCASGVRSMIVSDFLAKQHDFKYVYNLIGGLKSVASLQPPILTQ
jgi:rhodanese-related sulfurtransferase